MKLKDIFDGKAWLKGGVNEANADGTISKDEEKRTKALLKKAEDHAKHLLDVIKKESDAIGGPYRGPGIRAQLKKIALKYASKI